MELNGIEMDPRLPKEYEELSSLFKEKSDDDSLPKHQPWDHEIPLEPGTRPGYMPIYQMSELELKALREYLKDRLAKGYITPSTSPAGYPVMFVPKKGNELQFCVNYQQLNKITIKNRYALPLISELQDRFHRAKWFTKLDVRDAYALIRMKEGEEWKTAFRCRYGHYEYTVMPFGLTNAPATFQRLMNKIFREEIGKFVAVYLDDIIIFSTTFEEHLQHLQLIFKD